MNSSRVEVPKMFVDQLMYTLNEQGIIDTYANSPGASDAILTKTGYELIEPLAKELGLTFHPMDPRNNPKEAFRPVYEFTKEILDVLSELSGNTSIYMSFRKSVEGFCQSCCNEDLFEMLPQKLRECFGGKNMRGVILEFEQMGLDCMHACAATMALILLRHDQCYVGRDYIDYENAH